MTAEITLPNLYPPRPYVTRSHIHGGPLVIGTETPSHWLNQQLHVQYTCGPFLVPLTIPGTQFSTRLHVQCAMNSLHNYKRSGSSVPWVIPGLNSPWDKCIYVYMTRSFGFFHVWPGLQDPTVWPLGLVFLYVHPHNPVYVRRFRFCFSI